GQDFTTRLLVLSVISVIMTVGVYGLVAGIVKLDDAGLYLSKAGGAARRAIGAAILKLAPWLMKTLSVVGTAAMFMVGGGILVHGFAPVHHAVEHAAEVVATWPGVGGLLAALTPALLGALLGIVAGGLVVLVVLLGQRLFGRSAATTA
ncbi:MAG: DUF808 family protein, partial [Panacagrimonas sp.]